MRGTAPVGGWEGRACWKLTQGLRLQEKPREEVATSTAQHRYCMRGIEEQQLRGWMGSKTLCQVLVSKATEGQGQGRRLPL
jgi:hypothetical protein